MNLGLKKEIGSFKMLIWSVIRMTEIFIILTDDRIFHEIPSCECQFTEDGLSVNTLDEFPYEEIAVIGKYAYNDELGSHTIRIWESEEDGQSTD